MATMSLVIAASCFTSQATSSMIMLVLRVDERGGRENGEEIRRRKKKMEKKNLHMPHMLM